MAPRVPVVNYPAQGATPRTGATPDQLYRFGPGFAAYRLPFPGANSFIGAREVGIVLDGEPAPDAGANPPTGGDPKPPADPPKPPATGAPEPDADGMTTDAGREALRKERDRAARAEKALADIQAAHASDDEKRDASLKAAAAQERDEYWSSRIRRAEVRSALRSEGLMDDKALALAANAPAFESLKVDEDGNVPELAKTVAAFKTDYPQLFTPAKAGSGQPTRGPQNGGAPTDRPKTLAEAVAAGMRAPA